MNHEAPAFLAWVLASFRSIPLPHRRACKRGFSFGEGIDSDFTLNGTFVLLIVKNPSGLIDNSPNMPYTAFKYIRMRIAFVGQ